MATTPAARPFVAFKWGLLTIAFFSFLAWLLLLGGVSALQDVCDGRCRVPYGLPLPWFIIWFQFFIILPVFAVEFIADGAAFRPVLALLLAINTVLCIIQADKFLTIRDTGGSNSRVNSTIAGFILTSIFNLLLIILSGSRSAVNSRFGEDRDVGVATYPPKERAAAATQPAAPAPQVTVPPPQSTYGTTGSTAV